MSSTHGIYCRNLSRFSRPSSYWNMPVGTVGGHPDIDGGIAKLVPPSAMTPSFKKTHKVARLTM